MVFSASQLSIVSYMTRIHEDALIFPVITQPFLLLRPRVSVKASSTSLLDVAESNNRHVLTIISYEAVEQSLVTLLELFV